jgi:general stress protein CsbA
MDFLYWDNTVNIFKAVQSRDPEESLWDFMVRTSPWIFSHHPADKCFKEHVWTLRGLHFCKGCVMTVAGWVVAAGLQISSGWLQRNDIGLITAIFFALLLPSVLTSLLGAPRILKHIARLLLGVLMASSVWLFIVTDKWWVKGVLLVVYFIVKTPLDRHRRRQNERILQGASLRNGNPINDIRPRGKSRRAH